MRRVVIVLFALLCGTARADEISDDEVNLRLEYLHARLAAEGHQTHIWEAAWSVVYVGGLGYSAYSLGRSNGDRAEFADGLIGMTKSFLGGTRLILAPRNSSLGARPLDGMPNETPADRLQQLLRAELLLRRNATESRYRRSWIPHVISAAVNVVGGAIVWANGDFYKALQSTGIGLAAGELNIWTQPWRAANDERDYRRTFGAYAGPDVSPAPATKPGMSVHATANGMKIVF